MNGKTESYCTFIYFSIAAYVLPVCMAVRVVSVVVFQYIYFYV